MANNININTNETVWPDNNRANSIAVTEKNLVNCKHLNFKVPPAFHRDFKTWAARHDISMTTLLMEAFNRYCEQEKK